MVVCPDWDIPYPRVSYGEGAYLFDESGKKYLDASSGSAGVANLGHGNREVAEVIAAQVARVAVTPTHAFASAVVEEYLHDLVAFAPEGCSKAWLAGSGTEAIENALKLALQYHQIRGEEERNIIISRWGSYHGNSIFTLDVGGMRSRRVPYGPWLQNPPHIGPAYAYRNQGDLPESQYALKAASELEEAVLSVGPERVAGFIAEPVVAAALGAVPAPEGYFRHIREICDRYGILLIADEVLCGFGRTGANFGLDHAGIRADIIATGKGISGGYFPLSAIILQDRVAAEFEAARAPFYGGHTFACNPVGAAVGAWALRHLREHDLVARAARLGEVFSQKLGRLYKHSIVGDIRGKGLMMGIEFVADRTTKSPFPKELAVSKWIARRAMDKGVVVYPGGGCVDGRSGDHIVLYPPLIVVEEDLDRIVDALDESIHEFERENLAVMMTHRQ
ncbi:MAG: aminotransferase class III-fold pyridoxal phosphate-dependent enzyme [Bacteroidia bacterium]